MGCALLSKTVELTSTISTELFISAESWGATRSKAEMCQKPHPNTVL